VLLNNTIGSASAVRPRDASCLVEHPLVSAAAVRVYENLHLKDLQ